MTLSLFPIGDDDDNNNIIIIIINNQVLRKIKIAVENDVKNWAYISLR